MQLNFGVELAKQPFFIGLHPPWFWFPNTPFEQTLQPSNSLTYDLSQDNFNVSKAPDKVVRQTKSSHGKSKSRSILWASPISDSGYSKYRSFPYYSIASFALGMYL